MTDQTARERKSYSQRIYREKERQDEQTRLMILRRTVEFYRLISRVGR